VPDPVVIKVGRDAGGVTYSGDTDTPAPQAAPAPKPVKVRSKRAAEKLDWRFIADKPEHIREIPGTNLLEKVTGYFEAEKACGDLNGFPTILRRCASTMKNLLAQIEQTENDRRRRELP
jgi:hypothetical protein